jgi:hypothetical protein
MKKLVLILSVTMMIAGIVMTAVAADTPLKVVQKFAKESIIGWNGNITFADVNGDGHKDMVARYSKSSKMIAGIWLWRGTKFSDSVDCSIDLGMVVETKVFAGDLNGDGKADLAFLSQYSNSNPPKVVWGRATWPKTISTADMLCGAVQDSSFESQGQYSSMAIADFNADGFADLCYQIQGNDTSGTYAGLYGSMLAVYYGGAPMDSIPDWVYKGGHAYTITGTSNTITPRYFSPWHMDVGDFNGDGYMDLLTSGWNAYSSISAYNFKGSLQSMFNCGSGLIFLGGPNFNTSPRPDVILMASDNWLKYTTAAQYLWLGYSVYNAGDVNGDMVDDVSLPGWYMDIALVFAGNKSWTKAASDANVLVVRDELLSYTKNRFDFAGYADQFGVDVMSIGDVNGDGLGDLAATRNFFGGYASEERGLRLFLTKAGKKGAMKVDYETADYIQVMPGSIDFDNDGVKEFLAYDANYALCVLKVNPVYIASVADVPNDQGGHVRVSFSSTVDNDVSKYPYFSIWRALPTDAIVVTGTRGIDAVTQGFTGKASMTTSANGTSYRWEWVKNVPAQLMGNYAADVPTLYDGTLSSSGKHMFMVVAHTGDPNVFYMSDADTGASVDNLAPAAPAPFQAQIQSGKAVLTWNANDEADLKQYLVFKSSTPGIPDNAPVYASTTSLNYTDPVALGDTPVYYVVKAQDVHGNVGPGSGEIRISLVGVELIDTSVPTDYTLSQNYPNPFNPTTTIEYALKQAGSVTLKVLNVLGEEIATIESGFRPAGRYSVSFDASRLASGVYLYQIRSGNFVDVKRMMLIK